MINSYRKYALILVVFIHSGGLLFHYAKIEMPFIAERIFRFLTQEFHATSILAAISGYLFFKNFSFDRTHMVSFFKTKYLHRIKSILIPYVFWVSLFFVVNNGLIYLAMSSGKEIFNNPYRSISLGNYLSSLVFPEMGLAYHLWYLNNLLFAFILTPVFVLASRNKLLTACFFIGIASFYLFFPDDSMVKFRFIMFFFIGAFLSLNKNLLFRLLGQWKLLSSVAAVSLVCTYYLTNSTINEQLIIMAQNTMTVLLLFLLTFKVIQYFNYGQAVTYNRANHFLLYVIHPFLIGLVCKAFRAMSFFSLYDFWYLLAFSIITAILTLKMNDYIYLFLARFFPRLTRKLL